MLITDSLLTHVLENLATTPTRTHEVNYQSTDPGTPTALESRGLRYSIVLDLQVGTWGPFGIVYSDTSYTSLQNAIDCEFQRRPNNSPGFHCPECNGDGARKMRRSLAGTNHVKRTESTSGHYNRECLGGLEICIVGYKKLIWKIVTGRKWNLTDPRLATLFPIIHPLTNR